MKSLLVHLLTIFVHNNQVSDFTPYMKNKLVRVLPEALATRLVQGEAADDDPLDVIFPQRGTLSSEDRECASTEQEQAERRMQQAYAEGGIVKFGQQMWIEFEREWTEARSGREQLPSAGASDPNTGSNSGIA